MDMYELETWLGEARGELTDQQVEDILEAVNRHEGMPGYSDKDDETAEAVLTAIVQFTLGELDLAAAGRAYRRAKHTAEAYALGAVLAGMPEAQAARESTLDRMTVRKLLGKR